MSKKSRTLILKLNLVKDRDSVSIPFAENVNDVWPSSLVDCRMARLLPLGERPAQVFGAILSTFRCRVLIDPVRAADDLVELVHGEFRKRPEFLRFFSLIPSRACATFSLFFSIPSSPSSGLLNPVVSGPLSPSPS